MIEKFEDRKLFGKIRIVCKMEGSPSRVWEADKATVVGQIQAIVSEYSAQGYRLTLRQLHYQFVSRNWIVNHIAAYKKLGEVLDDCRYGGLVDWDAIVDRGRVPYLPYWALDVKDALKDTVDRYRVDRQDSQPTHIEVWTEKDALSEIMRRSTKKYHVRLCVNKGYTSSSAAYESYDRFADIINEGQDVVILYFGDHDPSGLDMIRDIQYRVDFMLRNGRHGIGEGFTVVPIGLSMEQIKKYKCPPNPTKLTDNRTPKYVKKFGRTCWEVDALPPEALTEILDTNIERFMDMDQYLKMLRQEGKDLAQLKRFIKKAK